MFILVYIDMNPTVDIRRTDRGSKGLMYVCFAEASGPYSGAFNKFVSLITGGKFCHVTVIFELLTEKGVVFQECSIVKCKDDTLSRVHFSQVEDMKGWKCYHLRDLDRKSEIEAYEYTRDHLLGVPYETSRMFLEYVPCLKYSSGYSAVNTQSNEPVRSRSRRENERTGG